MSGTGTWRRPASIPYPTVWSKYEGLLNMPDGKKPKFIIRDLTEEYLEDVIHFMLIHFCRDEAMFGCLNACGERATMKELDALWRQLIKDKVAIVALVDDGASRPRIAGCNFLFVLSKTDRFSADVYEGPAMKKMARDGFIYVLDYINMFERYGVNEYLSSFGLIVHPDFRGQGLGPELLRTRFKVGKAMGLKLTMTFFTSVGGQKSSEKAGMEVLADIPYITFKDDDGKESYPNIYPKSLKIKVKVFD